MSEAPGVGAARAALSPGHVARATRPGGGPLYAAHFTLLEDHELDALAAALTAGRPRPLAVFAYGSLIWNPGFAVAARRPAVAPGWHRQFSISLEHFRGSPEAPGLMLALAPGGSCGGLLLEIAPADEAASLRALLKRELVARELVRNACWIEVESARGREAALTFYADPVDTEIARLTLPEQAQRLARANGAAGSGAEYLYNTVQGLAAAGIDDPYIHDLQALVAAEIDALHPPPAARG